MAIIESIGVARRGVQKKNGSIKGGRVRLNGLFFYSIPMYERGFVPFHHGWNVIDCGGEGHYREAHAETARAMAEKYLEDLKSDGRTVAKIICQNLSCVEHLAASAGVPVVYWLDEVMSGGR